MNNLNTFEPKRDLCERYSSENMAKQREMSVDDLKLQIDKEIKMKQDIIDNKLSKGWIQEQAETHAMRCLYIDGFSAPTFKD